MLEAFRDHEGNDFKGIWTGREHARAAGSVPVRRAFNRRRRRAVVGDDEPSSRSGDARRPTDLTGGAAPRGDGRGMSIG